MVALPFARRRSPDNSRKKAPEFALLQKRRRSLEYEDQPMDKNPQKTTRSTATTATKASTKRPRIADARLSDLMAAAADVFIEQGFDNASLKEISKRAGASKATLYARYPNKEALFTAVLQHRMEGIAQTMTMDNIDPTEPLEVSLTRFGTGLLENALTDPQIAIVRTISTVSSRFPQLGEQYYRLGTLFGIRTLSGYLQAKQERGELVGDEPPELMAQQFITLSIDSLLYRKLLGIAGRQSQRDRTAQVARAVKMFLRCYASKTTVKTNVQSRR
jgi:TetR/AcrR family transcriptional repressor of mexJK operon